MTLGQSAADQVQAAWHCPCIHLWRTGAIETGGSGGRPSMSPVALQSGPLPVHSVLLQGAQTTARDTESRAPLGAGGDQDH